MSENKNIRRSDQADTSSWRDQSRIGPALHERQEHQPNLLNEDGMAPSGMRAFKGRRDRKKESNARFQHMRRLREHAEKEVSFTAILTMSEMSMKDLDAETAFQLTQNTQVQRHNVFCNFIERHLIKNRYSKQRIGDIKVKDFVRTLVNYDTKDHSGLTTRMASLTPDILLYDNIGNVIHLGDISVSSNVHHAIQRKTEKYSSVVIYLRSIGYSVNESNFIIDSSFSNLESNIRLFEDNLIMGESLDLQLYKMFALEARTLLSVIRESCIDIQGLDEKIDKSESPPGTHRDDKTYSWNDNFYDDVDIDPYVPFKTEEETIQVIKDEVDRMMQEGEFFETDHIKTELAFTELIDKNKQYDEFDSPKSTLKVVDNCNMYEEKNDHDLAIDYLTDIINGPIDDIQQYIVGFMPSIKQLEVMKKIKLTKPTLKDIRNSSMATDDRVFGTYQFSRCPTFMNQQLHEYDKHITMSKKNPNAKKEPKHLNPVNYPEYIRGANTSISYYGSPSEKPDFLDSTWDSVTPEEFHQTTFSRQCYEYCKSTNGAQHANSMSFVYNRMTHLSSFLSKKDNIIIPPNGSFIAVIGKEHCPTNRKSCEMPFVFLTRTKTDKPLNHIEYEYTYKTTNYIYYVSNLCRFNTEKAETWNNAGYKLVATSSYLLAQCPELWASREKLCGILFHFLIDTHQKLSEFLDLLKYVSFMPFSTLHKLPSLIAEKFDIMLKTRMDVWILHQMKDFLLELSKVNRMLVKKPPVKRMNLNVGRESLGIDMALPSFIDTKVKHGQVTQFIEEISMLFTIRPKQLYGSQYMDKSTTKTAKWNLQYEMEKEKFGGWVIDGHDDTIPYPHSESDFSFDSDVIYWSNKLAMLKQGVTKSKVEAKIAKSGYNDPMHNACSLRGCTKSVEERNNNEGMHTTTLNACLKQYKEDKYDPVMSKASSFARKYFESGNKMEFSMSAKQQRGSGRPIATGTLLTKAALRQTEIPESCRGMLFKNNIIVQHVNKLSVQCETYKSVLAAITHEGYDKIVQMTEDQKQYSETDNLGKYKIYVRCDTGVPIDMKKVQMKTINALSDRIHYFKHLPKAIENDPDLAKYLTKDKDGIRVIIGWPQGMLNNLSTSVHANMDIWITDSYNKAYPDNTVYAKGLVHSDDSWMAVGCNTITDLKTFALFRMIAKRMACLKLNTKKLWISAFMGEMVSHFNINGNVHLSVAKVLANSFTNLTFQNWPIDVHNQVSAIQQAYRHGATLGDITMMSTILRQQMVATYHVVGFQKENLYKLPVDIGGYPNSSPYELGVTGLSSHYSAILDHYRNNKTDRVTIIVNKLLQLSLIKHSECHTLVNNELIRNPRTINDYGDGRDLDIAILNEFADYEAVKIPCRGEVFRIVSHVMPRVRKMAETLKSVRELPFESNDMEMILTRPLDFDQSLMNLKAQTKGMLYELSTSSYTNDTKRMAAAQAMQSSGRVVKIGRSPAMTLNEMYDFVLKIHDSKRDFMCTELMVSAFSDDTELTDICNAVVRSSTVLKLNQDKRKIITHMPEIGSRFRTIGDLKDVLIYMIDKRLGTNFKSQRPIASVCDETLKIDSKLIEKRFIHLFKYYDCKKACSIIMQQFMLLEKERTWVQPHLRCENLQTFLEELYGKTLHHIDNFSVDVSYTGYKPRSHNSDIVQTLYCTEVLNEIYENKVQMTFFNDLPLADAIQQVDYSNFDDNEMLKYGVLKLKYCNDSSGLDTFCDRCVYQEWWQTPQKINKEGHYYGPFIATVRCFGITIKIYGSPGSIDFIMMSSMQPLAAMRAMHIFVQKNYPDDRYGLPTAWGHAPFWNQNQSFDSVTYIKREPSLAGALTGIFMNYYSTVNTRLETEQSTTSIQVVINQMLTISEPPLKTRPKAYEFDDHLRKVYRIDDERTKLGSIKHNFSLPLRKLVSLSPATISSMPNTLLYSKNVLSDLVTQKTYNISKDTIQLCLEQSTIMSNKTLFNFFINYYEWISSKDYNVVTDETRDVELAGTFKVFERSPFQLEETERQADPFDLASVHTSDYEFTYNRVGSLYKVLNVRYSLAKILSGNPSENRSVDFIAKLSCNDETLKIYKHYIKDKPNIKAELLTSIDDYHATKNNDELEWFCFIYVNNLHSQDFWQNLDPNVVSRIDLSNMVFTDCPKLIDQAINLFYNDVLELSRKIKRSSILLDLAKGLRPVLSSDSSDNEEMYEFD